MPALVYFFSFLEAFFTMMNSVVELPAFSTSRVFGFHPFSRLVISRGFFDFVSSHFDRWIELRNKECFLPEVSFPSLLLCFLCSPLTDLLRSTGGGRQRIPWSWECNRSFELIKDMLTSAPLLRHFDPSLRTAVHVDASQNAVGAVLLQWAPRLSSCLGFNVKASGLR